MTLQPYELENTDLVLSAKKWQAGEQETVYVEVSPGKLVPLDEYLSKKEL